MKTAVACIFLLMLGGGQMNQVFGKEASEKKVNHYSFKLPVGYISKDITPPMMDFELIEIHKAKSHKTKLVLYFGNNPSFPKFKWDTSPMEEKDGNRTRRSFGYRESDGAMEGVLIFTGLSYRGSNQSPYTQIHYFASGVDKNSAGELSGIIASLKVVEPNLN